MTLLGIVENWLGLALIALVVLAVSWGYVMWRVARRSGQKGAGEATAAAPKNDSALADPAPLAAIARLIEEFETLRDEVQGLRDEIVELRGQIVLPPASAQYGEAMALAQRGADPDQIAEHCGISRGEAELVLALQQRKTKAH